MIIMPQDNLPFGQDFLPFSVSSFVEKRKEERMQLFFQILMNREMLPEERADILMNGTVHIN